MRLPLHLATWNLENFYLLLDRPLDRPGLDALSDDAYAAMNHSIYNPNKERGKIAEIARIILEGDLDVVGLCEVGGRETLENFNRLYLDRRYDCYLHEENSRRGIYVGALVRKGRFPGARARSVGQNFSRNLLRLDLGPAAMGLVVYVVHLKSQLGQDSGIGQRIREIKLLASLVRHRNCVIMGDFNGIAIRGQAQFEFEALLDLPLTDVLEQAGVPAAERRTHYYFSPAPSHNQLDYIFCTPDIQLLHAAVVEGDIPLNRDERAWLPSDHMMLRAAICPAGYPVPVHYEPAAVRPSLLFPPEPEDLALLGREEVLPPVAPRPSWSKRLAAWLRRWFGPKEAQ